MFHHGLHHGLHRSHHPSAARCGHAGWARFLDAQEQRRVGRIQWDDLVAYARACGGVGGVLSIASLMVATGTSSRGRAVIPGCWS